MLRATRLCLMSPTIATRSPSKPAVRCRAARIVYASSSAWVGWACQPSPALITLAVVHPSTSSAGTARTVPHDERIDAHRGDRLDRVAQALALVDARLADGEGHRVGRQPLGRRLEAEPGARRVLEEHVADGLAPQCRHLRIRPAVDLGHVVGEVEDALDAGGPEVLDRQERRGHEITTPSTVADTDSAELVGRFLPTKSGLIGSSRWPRSTSTASWTALGRP